MLVIGIFLILNFDCAYFQRRLSQKAWKADESNLHTELAGLNLFLLKAPKQFCGIPRNL